MKKLLLTVFLSLTVILGFFVSSVDARVYAKGYTKKNGTYVAPHYRSDPDSSPYNNYSYPGNYNPNTGKITTGNPSTYLKNYYNSTSGSSTYTSSSYDSSTYNFDIPSYTYSTSSVSTYVNPLEKELNGCKLLAKTLDEVVNVNNVYKVTLGRDASCGELTDNVRVKTPHDKLKKSLESSAEGKSYKIQMNILNSSEGKTIRDRSDGKFYLIKNHEKHWTPDQLTMNAHGLIYEDAPVLNGNVVAQISEGPQLKYWEGKYYKTVEAIRIGNKVAIKFLPKRLMEVYK